MVKNIKFICLADNLHFSTARHIFAARLNVETRSEEFSSAANPTPAPGTGS